jgi:hypothetical protein
MKRQATKRPAVRLPKVGDCLAFSYPTVAGRIRLEVLAVRDLEEKPLAALTLALHPNRPRGRFLITGFDVDRLRLRKVYVEHMTEVEAINRPDWVLASYDPANPDKPPRPLPQHCAGDSPRLVDLFVLMQRGNAHAAVNPKTARLLGIFSREELQAASE